MPYFSIITDVAAIDKGYGDIVLSFYRIPEKKERHDYCQARHDDRRAQEVRTENRGEGHRGRRHVRGEAAGPAHAQLARRTAAIYHCHSRRGEAPGYTWGLTGRLPFFREMHFDRYAFFG